MKVAILHQDLEYAERAIKKVFEEKYGANVNMFDIRNTNIRQIYEFNPRFILNRVYASVANRRYEDVQKTLELLTEAERKNIPAINSYKTSVYDYSKFESARVMKEAGILTPETILIKDLEKSHLEIDSFIETYHFPLILKRDTGGRGKDIARVTSREELYSKLESMFSNAKEEKYKGGFVVQEFMKSIRDHDCRIGIIDGKFALSYGRSLISIEGEENWLASVAKGSSMFDYEPSKEEITIAKRATSSIGALFNEVDMMFTSQGVAIIENNPTPNYDETELDRIETASKKIMSRFN